MATIQPLDEQKKKQLAPTAQPASLPSAVGAATMAASAPIQPGQPTMAAAARPAWVAQGAQLGAATNAQLATARSGMGSNAARTNRTLTQLAQSVDPAIRDSAEARRAWRIMTPQQRREHIGMKKVEQEAFQTKAGLEGRTWEDIDAMARPMGDATGTTLDSYGSSSQFYTPDQMEYMRAGRREFDKEAAEFLSNADKSAFASPQELYQAMASLPSAQKYGDFLGSYIFSKMRQFATPQMRAQMEAEDRNQKLFRDWMVSRGAEEIAKAQAQYEGFRFTNDGTGDLATQIFLNRDKDLASGQIYRQFLAETPQVYTAIDGKVVIDQARAAKFNEEARQKATQEERAYREEQAQKTKDEALSQKEQAAQETIRIRDEANPLQRGRFKINPVSKEIEDTYEYTQGDIARLSEDERVKRSSALLEEISTWSGLLGFENETDETVAARIEAMKPNLLNPALAEQTQAGIDNLMANWNLYKSMGGAEEIKYEIEAKKRLRNKYKGVQ